MMSRLGSLLIGCALAACGGNPPAGGADSGVDAGIDLAAHDGATDTAAQMSLGTTGGTVTTPGGAAVAIPANALTSTVIVSVTPTESAPMPTDVVVVGTPYTFGPEGQQFSLPATITLPFDADSFPTGKTAADIVIYTAPAGSSTFTHLTTHVVDATHVSATTTHFSVFIPTIAGQIGGGGCTPACAAGQYCTSAGTCVGA